MRNDRERVTMALDLLVAGLAPFVERELKSIFKDRWEREARSSFRDSRSRNDGDHPLRWDAHCLLTVMWDQWNRAFRGSLAHSDRSLVSELREFRNQWAHQRDFAFDDTYRMIDSVERLLESVGSPLSKRVHREKRDLMRTKFMREAKAAYQKSQMKKRLSQDLMIYATCCAAIIVVILQLLGWQAWVFATFVVFVFSYLAYQRAQTQPPMIFGPHECGACHRIIYGAECPYCERTPRQDVVQMTAPVDSSPKLAEVPASESTPAPQPVAAGDSK